jgi:membrane protease YdiL (CAAX protease family)
MTSATSPPITPPAPDDPRSEPAPAPVQTAIGRGLADHRWLALAVAGSVIAVDMWLASGPRLSTLRGWPHGLLLPAVGGAALAVLIGWHRDPLRTLGLRLRPVQGWGYWLKAAALLGLLAAVLIAAGVGVLYLAGGDMATDPVPRSYLPTMFRQACIDAPVFEELLYRMILASALVAALGKWPAIAASGAVFAALHFAYGNPSPDNFIGGYLLAWAFVHSETLVVPWALHVLGNGCIVLGHALAG